MIDGHFKKGEVNVSRELFDEMTERDIYDRNRMTKGCQRGHGLSAMVV